jgi:putative ABC transport system permease protein
MIRNYLSIALRNLTKNKLHSFLNITGLSAGMAVALLIGLWVWDEVSFDKNNRNYDHIAQVVQNEKNNGETATVSVMPFPLADELRRHYGNNFKAVVMGTNSFDHVLAAGDKLFIKTGAFFEAGAASLLDLRIIDGDGDALKDPAAILLSESSAKAYFGKANPIDQSMKLDNNQVVKVVGVYRDIPNNSTFANLQFIASWPAVYQAWGMKDWTNPWRLNGFRIFVLLHDNADLARLSVTIRDAKINNIHPEERVQDPRLFLHAMSKWHLYSDFKNGVTTGGRIGYVRLFAIVGVFVLLLACINFMNLSTARSERRSREVGIRKTLGSLRWQLIGQFIAESVFIAGLSFVAAILLAQATLPVFNELSGKSLILLWVNPFFWAIGVGFAVLTGLIAGSYPALYLSSFRPVKVLRGNFRTGRLASLPRQALIVLQFTVSVVLIIGTLVVFRQIQFARSRPMGYDTNGLVMFPTSSNDIRQHADAFKRELQQSSTILGMTESDAYVSSSTGTTSGVEWPGMATGQGQDFPIAGIGYDYGKTVGWQFVAGRDFSRDYSGDSSALILNEAAVNFMSLKNPVGTRLKWNGTSVTIVGVIKNTIIESPYAPIRPSIAYLNPNAGDIVILKLNPNTNTGEALARIEAVYKKYAPGQLFNYHFADAVYGEKFGDEQRVGRLASAFTGLAILISCLGLFGMASFMAERRTKEIGVRKVLGASVPTLWRLLSKDFVLLVLLSLAIATPIAYAAMHQWLGNYAYHAALSWWIFAAAGAGALVLTILTVSFQTIKAATANPVKSLRSE